MPGKKLAPAPPAGGHTEAFKSRRLPLARVSPASLSGAVAVLAWQAWHLTRQTYREKTRIGKPAHPIHWRARAGVQVAGLRGGGGKQGAGSSSDGRATIAVVVPSSPPAPILVPLLVLLRLQMQSLRWHPFPPG